MNDIDVTPMKAEGSALVARAQALKVTNPEQFVAAGLMLNEVAESIKTIIAKFKDPKAKAWAAHKSISGLEAELLAPREQIKQTIQSAMNRFQQEDRPRREQEAAEAQRVEQKCLDDVAQAQAEQMQAAGQPELAEMVMDQAPVAAPVFVPPPKVAGIATQTYWEFNLLPEAVTHNTDLEEADLMDDAAWTLWNLPGGHQAIIDKLKERAAIIRKRLRRIFMTADATKIRPQVQSLKKDAELLCGGILVYSEERVKTTGRGGK